MAKTKDLIWISAGGQKHQLSAVTGKSSCGLAFRKPYPGCDRSDPMCKACTAAMRSRAR